MSEENIIIFVGPIKIVDEDEDEEIKRTLEKNLDAIKEASEEEEGCKYYQWWTASGDYYLLEIYKNQLAFDDHLKTGHMDNFRNFKKEYANFREPHAPIKIPPALRLPPILLNQNMPLDTPSNDDIGGKKKSKSKKYKKYSFRKSRSRKK